MLSIFKDGWNGRASLAQAFWLVYLVFGFIISFIIFIVLSVSVTDFNLATNYNLLMAIILPYMIYSAICVWRCGKNSSMRWVILTKIIIVIMVLSGLFSLLHVVRGY